VGTQPIPLPKFFFIPFFRARRRHSQFFSGLETVPLQIVKYLFLTIARLPPAGRILRRRFAFPSFPGQQRRSGRSPHRPQIQPRTIFEIPFPPSATARVAVPFSPPSPRTPPTRRAFLPLSPTGTRPGFPFRQPKGGPLSQPPFSAGGHPFDLEPNIAPPLPQHVVPFLFFRAEQAVGVSKIPFFPPPLFPWAERRKFFPAGHFSVVHCPIGRRF